ncbi:hypothetical protein BH10PSE19_BH10PSE19_03410 [soil metagenome]
MNPKDVAALPRRVLFALRWIISLGLISFLLNSHAQTNQNASDSFDKYRQQALDAAKTKPAAPDQQFQPRQQQNNNLSREQPTPSRPPNPPMPSPYAVPPSTQTMDKAKTQQPSQPSQPANIWLKPNPWGNTTNNPWAPNKSAATSTGKMDKANEKQSPPVSNHEDNAGSPAPLNIFAPGS